MLILPPIIWRYTRFLYLTGKQSKRNLLEVMQEASGRVDDSQPQLLVPSFTCKSSSQFSQKSTDLFHSLFQSDKWSRY